MKRLFSLAVCCCLILGSVMFLFSCDEQPPKTSYEETTSLSGYNNTASGSTDSNDRPESSPVNEAETQKETYDNKNDQDLAPLY